MYDFKEMRERLKQWYRDTHLDSSAESVDLANHEKWKEALADNIIFFDPGDSVKVKYESFKDIDFTGPEYNHIEWRSQLNRFYWLTHAAYEYDKTHDEHWAKIARDAIENWIEYRPTVATDTLTYAWEQCGDNCLSVSRRLGQGDLDGWFGSLPYFEGSKYFDEEFMDRVIASTKDQLVFLERWHTRTGNFCISECHTILFLSYMMPEHFGQYRKFAVDGINEAFRLQIETDGSHIEHTIGYHKWMARVFSEFAILAKSMPELGLNIPTERLFKMYDYELANYTPDGRTFGINDEGRWYEGREATDIAARYEEINKLRAYFGLEPIDSCGYAFPNAGQYFFKSGDDALCLDSTKYFGFHTHIVRNSVLFYHGDRLQLCDPGSLSYESSDPFCYPGRNSRMHNTVTVNDWCQCHFADAVVPVCVDNEKLSFIISCYGGGYASAGVCDIPENKAKSVSCAGRHNRVVLWIKGKFAVVFDAINTAEADFTFAAHWQFLNEKVMLTENGMHTCSDGANVLVCTPWSSHEIKPVMYNGDYEKKLGFISPNGSSQGSGAPAPMLSIEGKGDNAHTVRLLTVIAPFEGDAVPTVTANVFKCGGILHAEVTYNGETWHFAVDSYLIGCTFVEEVGSTIGEVGGIKSGARAAVLCPDGQVWEYC